MTPTVDAAREETETEALSWGKTQLVAGFRNTDMNGGHSHHFTRKWVRRSEAENAEHIIHRAAHVQRLSRYTHSSWAPVKKSFKMSSFA